MKRIVPFSRYFLPTAIASIAIIVSGFVAYGVFGGFNRGVDFQAGLIQEVQFAPTAFSITWDGKGAATISFNRNTLYIVITGAGVENKTNAFAASDYPTLDALAQAMKSQIDGLSVDITASPDINTQWLVYNAQGSPQLGATPYSVHYLAPGSAPISIATVREAMTSLGQTVAVQSMGLDTDRHFMIRVEAKGITEGQAVMADKINSVLQGYFGAGQVIILRSDFVGSRFSKDLSDRAAWLVGLSTIIIMLYCSFRFKFQYAVGMVIAILHDALIMVAYVSWSRMEFNTITIAAIMTILGYSINDKIVVFDRIREAMRIYPDDPFVTVLNRAITETLSRTFITTFTTMLAALFLFVFTSGSMKDFALLMLIGLISSIYSTIFVASSVANLWQNLKMKHDKRKAALSTAAKA
ncbi:MAG: protein translocase subunit SecF [Treponema sp.]|nr:protein translocase subunit SecF [Treponema sp.]